MRLPMRRDRQIESLLARNLIVTSMEPIPVRVARKYFHALLAEVETRGRSYQFIFRNLIVGQLEPVLKGDVDHV
jgi:hypothetical protein